MTPEEWPIAAFTDGGNDLARPAGRDRLSTVRHDFFLDPAQRLTEQERALMTAMLGGLVSETANAVRAALPNGRLAANDEDDAALVTTLTRARLLDDAGVMAVLLRSADAERIAVAVRTRSSRREARIVQGLVSHDQGTVASAAMALILARGRRRDRFGQFQITLDDVPADGARNLVQAIAAGLRRELTSARGATPADHELAVAARQVLAQRDGDRGISGLTAKLIDALDQAGALTDDFVLAAALEGELALVTHFIARRAGTSPDVVFDELLSGEPRTAMALFRSAGISRNLVAGILAGIGELLGLGDPGQAIEIFDAMSDADVSSARSWRDSAPEYRLALDRLGKANG